MEAMVKNLRSTVELLAVATHSNFVAHWDQETLQRAFHWALYCEHICNRFHNNPAIRTVLERQLEVANQSLAALFPQYSAICFSDLSRCQHLLLHGLLHNIHAPISILKILFDKPVHINKNQDRYQEVKGICSSIVERKSALKILENVTTTSAAEAEVQAELVLNKLDTVLKQTNGTLCANQFLDSILQGCEESRDKFCVVIASALQNESNPLSDFILDWLALKPSLLERMCHSLPSSLLTETAKKHNKFRDLFTGVLKKWAIEMEYDINNIEWIQVSRIPPVSFQKLTEHFVSLFQASISLRDHVETELKTLKFADGDFDVRGLSVWGDLLSDIHQKCPCHS